LLLENGYAAATFLQNFSWMLDASAISHLVDSVDDDGLPFTQSRQDLDAVAVRLAGLDEAQPRRLLLIDGVDARELAPIDNGCLGDGEHLFPISLELSASKHTGAQRLRCRYVEFDDERAAGGVARGDDLDDGSCQRLAGQRVDDDVALWS
jgi:hypothetical protein